MKKDNHITQKPVIFVHSLFRSGSTYFYNALKRTGLYHVYHEPMHEIIDSLPSAWNELADRKEQLKAMLRHDFLQGGYFDEYAHLLPAIKRTFDSRLSFESFFMDAKTNFPELKTYLDTLIEGSQNLPILQCTRTIGRIGWIKANYVSKHVFLLRNPWDQWYSYKVDSYIAATPRVIYSQLNLPAVLKEVMASRGLLPLPGDGTQAKLIYSYAHPISPEADYCLFFGVWLYSYIASLLDCDVVLDMDEVSSSQKYRRQALQRLADIGLTSISLDDAHLHRAVFTERERSFYQIIEDQVLEIFRQYKVDVGVLKTARDYLNRHRDLVFVSDQQTDTVLSNTLEDAARLREMLLTTGQYNGVLVNSLNQAVAERDKQIAILSQAIAKEDEQITILNQAITKEDEQIAILSQAVAEREGQIAILSQAVAEREGQIAILSQAMVERDGSIINLTDETVRRGEWALRLDAELKEVRTRLIEITHSNSWRITLPLREARRWITTPRQQAKRYVKWGLRLVKRIYQSLPLSYQTKAVQRNALAKYFPKLLLVSGSHSATIPVLTPPVMKQAMPEQFSKPEIFAKTYEIPASQNPRVSVIIPVYGKIDYTLRCLASIAANPPQSEFEVIIVDDCSPDNSVEVLTNFKSIRLVRNKQNQGFICSCNAGANAAQGEYLYFLNNDTEVKLGWLDELLRTFQEFPGTGLAGSKLIYPDGRLQEAGGIIWQDGSAWNFGRFQDPQLPIYNYAREVDYCSGASIMVSKELFEELGGFDERYLPAYCEDSDLALKVRDKGYRVIYQPMSTVIHHEGITSGTDIMQGTKAYQIENSKKLHERWKNCLQTHQPTGADVDNAKDRRASRRVLVIDHCTPTPNQDAGSVTAFNLMLLLREMDFQVTFIPEDNFLYMPEHTTALQRAGIEVLYAPYVTSVEQHLKECGDRYDLALLFRPAVVERQIKTIRKHCPKAKVLFHTVDLHFLRMFREAELQSDKIKQKAADEMKQRELTAIRIVDASIVHSTTELDILRPELPEERLHVFPLILDIPGTDKTFKDRCDIVFVGGYQHTPNIDAVQHFVSDVMPYLRRRLPGVCFYAVGSKPPAEIQALASEDVNITGFVEDLSPLLDKMRVSVAPLRYGAGIKGKIGSAMAVGLPVVATPLAAEGMSLTDGENILVAEGAEQFANAVVRLYQDETLWNRISHNGLEFAENAWGAEAAWKILNVILDDLGITTARGAYPLSLYASLDAITKKNKQQANELTPIASVQNREEFNLVMESNQLKKIRWVEKVLIESSKTEAFVVDGYCVPCSKKVPFLVDMQSGGQRQSNGWLPNWRERLECPLCRMNNRQRLIATLIKKELDVQRKKHVYFMEQVTPIYNWAVAAFKNHNIVGSEYLGHEYKGGTITKGIRHEDIENLSFSNDELDLIVSNDVFEHVPNPARAFAECARVLKVGGTMIATIPFHRNSDESITRAKITNGHLEHILPASFHGNPVSADGSLVFTDFGWDVLREMRVSGFPDVRVEIFASAELGHLGGGQLVFRAKK